MYTLNSPRLHLICGICGCNTKFRYQILENKNNNDKPCVFIKCCNCDSLTPLDEVSKEYVSPDGPILLSKNGLSEHWVVGFVDYNSAINYEILGKHHNNIFNYCFREYVGKVDDIVNCQVPLETIKKATNKEFCLIYRIVIDDNNDEIED